MLSLSKHLRWFYYSIPSHISRYPDSYRDEMTTHCTYSIISKFSNFQIGFPSHFLDSARNYNALYYSLFTIYYLLFTNPYLLFPNHYPSNT